MTHDVVNQPPELGDLDLFTFDPVLPGLVEHYGAAQHLDHLTAYGRRIGSREAFGWGFDANRFPPELRTHDRFGHRIDQVDFHPSWHHLMRLAVEHGVHSLPWEESPGGFVARAGLMYLGAQVEAGHGCPISMTAASVPALRHAPDVAAEWEPRITTRVYDPRFVPAEQKAGVLIGMGMTEKQGGSDVRTNTTRAARTADGYRITGHKWFTSAPMCDAFLILAQADGGLTCFFLPRWTPDGEVNDVRIQRLKDKLGNRSNASSEVEYHAAWAASVGDEGRGIATIIEMVNGTRLDCISGSAGLMRQAVLQAAHHVTHRTAFGAPLIEKPLMRNVLADLEVEVQAATALMARVAATFDRATEDEREALLQRILTPVAKYWVTKRCSEVVREALECLGGNGYVEDSILPRLYRESPLNAVWEGSGNVIALDLLRVVAREPAALEALREELAAHLGADSRYDRYLSETWRMFEAVEAPEYEGRRLAERLAVSVQAALAIGLLEPAVAELFLASRIAGDHGGLFGTLPPGLDPGPGVAAAASAAGR
jgi:putative acyl-CoA dehydrogenase